MPSIRHLFLSTLNILIFFSIFYFIFKINYIFRVEELFGSQIFLTDVVAPNAFSALIKFSIFIAGCIILVTLFNKLMMRYKNTLSEFSQTKTLMIILGISFFVKMMILGFNIDTDYDAKDTIDSVFINGEFNSYKLYNYLAYATYLLTDNYNFYLYIINIIFGTMTVGILYLIFSRLLEKDSSLFIIILLSLLCIPLTSIAVYLRVDSMYILLFITTFYYLIKLIEDNNNKDFIKLLLVLLLSCLCRESTLYMLPLFVFILLFSKHHKVKYILISSLVVLITSTLISSENLKNYGMKSKFKEFHLLVKAMQYGYLNENFVDSYKNNLSNNAQILLKDINNSYKKNILPSKRQSFYTEEKSILWTYIRPDYENVYIKNNLLNISTKENFLLAKNKLIKELNNSKKYISLKDLDNIFKQSQNNHNSSLVNIKSMIINDFYNDGTSFGHYKNVYKSCDDLTDSKLNRDCLIKVLENITYGYYHTRHDNAFYTKAALEVASNYDKESKKYKPHPNIQNITEIMLKIPMLYITQSLLTMTTMSGYHPNPSGVIKRSGVYESSVLPNIILIKIQGFYGLIVNFWYVFCAYVFFHSLFNKNVHSRNLKIIISLIPIYYGLFTSFATFAEFYRLMLVVVPLILYNYLMVLNILYNSLKNIITFFFQSKKLS